MLRVLAKTTVLCLLMVGVNAIGDTEQGNRPLYIIFDGSNSMWGELDDKSRKIAVAKEVFNSLDSSIFAKREVALRLYGHRRSGDCSDTELAVPFTDGNIVKQKLSTAVNGVTPRGRTPISRSLNAALKDFAGRSGDILLISDGIETCDADPCELIEQWREQDIDIRVHVVGLGLTDMARGAMQCIADASGTEYMDANSTVELSKAIETAAQSVPIPAGEANPLPPTDYLEFKIYGEDAEGKFLPVNGTISQPGMAAEKIANNFRYVFKGGEYTINVGVPTANGVLYKPITRQITVKEPGRTKIHVTLTRPPSVITNFLQNGKEVRGTGAYAYVDDRKVFGLRQSELFFVMPGTYEFRTNLGTDNSNLTVTEEIFEGEHKVINFNLIGTVHTMFNVFNQETGKRLRQHQELWQGGERKYKIHYNNGAKVQPGVYTLKSYSVHTPYVIENVEVPAVDRQKLNFELALGKVKIRYVVPAPSDTSKKQDLRCWLYSIDKSGNKSSNHGRMQRCDGESEIVLAAGRYFVHTTKRYGVFEDTYFDVKTGETTRIDVHLE